MKMIIKWVTDGNCVSTECVDKTIGHTCVARWEKVNLMNFGQVHLLGDLYFFEVKVSRKIIFLLLRLL